MGILFPENKAFLEEHPIQANGDILILAGDIIPFTVLDKNDNFLDEVAGKFESVYWIPGNHEYYSFDAAKKSGVLNEQIRKNVFLVNNITLLHNNVQFIFSTLWSKSVPLMNGDLKVISRLSGLMAPACLLPS